MKKAMFVSLFCFCAVLLTYGETVAPGTRRFGIFVGANNGGRNRAMLRYAVSDARAVSRVFTEMGGIDAADSILLVEPNLGELSRHIGDLRRRVASAKGAHKRTEIVFYYSGHSDEDGLLMNRGRYRYRELRDEITRIPSDMRVVILDSCSSGAFTRAKGGVKTQPFLFDDSISAEGYAFLTSSSATEASQESDAIGSSYFTHSLLAGLRGAADTVGDGRVTLNEVYRYAYAETLARTEVSRYGAQHPSYDMQVSGTGDMVLTDIKETSAGLIIHEEVAGRLSIRDSSDYLVAEITKTAGRSMELGLEPGLYRITLQRGNAFFRAEIILERDRRAVINPADFRAAAAPSSAARGDGEAEAPVKPVNIQFVPGVGLIGFDRRATNFVVLGLIGAIGYNLEGFGLSGIGLSHTGFVRGVQLSGIYNTVRRDMYGFQGAGGFNLALENTRGLQAAGIFNWTRRDAGYGQIGGIFNAAGGSFRGAQIAGIANVNAGSLTGFQGAGIFNWTHQDAGYGQLGGIFNVAGGSLRGAQIAGIANVAGGGFRGLQMGLVNYSGGGEGSGVKIGLINISKSEDVVPIGLINIVKNGMIHPAVWYDDLGFLNLSLKTGSKYVYSILGAGVEDLRFNRSSEFIVRAGIGAELSLGKAFIDLDLTAGNIFDRDSLGGDEDATGTLLAQARLSGGFKFFKHLGAFAGVSYDYILSPKANSPRPGRDFGFSALSRSDGRHTHKVGFFGGIQF
jgi:hypothetical protein